MRIRKLEAPDLGALTRITAASPEAASWSADAYKMLMDDPQRGEIWVAAQEQEIAGFASFRLVGTEAELLNIAVDPAWRRRGIGSQLLRRMLDELAARGVERIFLEVRASNAAARRLYERLGFKSVGVRRGYYRRALPDAPPTAVPDALPAAAKDALQDPLEDALVLARNLQSR